VENGTPHRSLGCSPGWASAEGRGSAGAGRTDLIPVRQKGWLGRLAAARRGGGGANRAHPSKTGAAEGCADPASRISQFNEFSECRYYVVLKFPNLKKAMTNTLDELANATVARFTVGFARHPPMHDVGNCFGSGILARYQNVEGILTCAHVVEAAHSQNSIAIIPNGVRDDRKSSIHVEFRLLRSHVIKGNVSEEDGPDLAFVQLPAITVSALASVGSVLNLERQQEVYKAPLRSPKFMEMLSGSVGEWMGKPIEKKTHTELENNIMVIGGKIGALGSSADYDRLLFKPGGTAPPKSYAGMSGGGIWRAGLQGDDAGGYTVEDRRLIGIAFYETAERSVIGHGKMSIYDKLLPEIAKWN
jgi:hypothetical protein